MRKIYRIVIIVLIFIVIGVWLCTELAFGLRPKLLFTTVVKKEVSGNGKIIINPLLPTHGDMYNLVKGRSRKSGKKILIFNVDAHTDKYNVRILDDIAPFYQDSSYWDSSWASELEREGEAIVLHMPSYWDGEDFWDETTRSLTNWRTCKHNETLGYLEWLLQEYEKHKDEMEEIWVTIDLDFFSLRTEVRKKHPRDTKSVRIPIYNLKPEEIDQEIAALVEFFESNNIKINRVIPSIPSSSKEYLNISPKKREAFIEEVTKKINRAFSKLSKRRENSIITKDKGMNVEETVYECWQALVTGDKNKVCQILENLAQSTPALVKHRFITPKDLAKAKRRYQYSFEGSVNPEAQMASLIVYNFLSGSFEYRKPYDDFLFPSIVAVENVLQHVVSVPAKSEALMLMFEKKSIDYSEWWIYIIDAAPSMPVGRVINGEYRAPTGRHGTAIQTLRSDSETIKDWAITSLGEQWNEISDTLTKPPFPTPPKGTLFSVHTIIRENITMPLIEQFPLNHASPTDLSL